MACSCGWDSFFISFEIRNVAGCATLSKTGPTSWPVLTVNVVDAVLWLSSECMLSLGVVLQETKCLELNCASHVPRALRAAGIMMS